MFILQNISYQNISINVIYETVIINKIQYFLNKTSMQLKSSFTMHCCGSRIKQFTSTYIMQPAMNELGADWNYWQTG